MCIESFNNVFGQYMDAIIDLNNTSIDDKTYTYKRERVKDLKIKLNIIQNNKPLIKK